MAKPPMGSAASKVVTAMGELLNAPPVERVSK